MLVAQNQPRQQCPLDSAAEQVESRREATAQHAASTAGAVLLSNRGPAMQADASSRLIRGCRRTGACDNGLAVRRHRQVQHPHRVPSQRRQLGQPRPPPDAHLQPGCPVLCKLAVMWSGGVHNRLSCANVSCQMLYTATNTSRAHAARAKQCNTALFPRVPGSGCSRASKPPR